MLSPGKLAQYIGFTEEEVKKLAESYHQEFVAINYDKVSKEHQCMIEEYKKAESL